MGTDGGMQVTPACFNAGCGKPHARCVEGLRGAIASTPSDPKRERERERERERRTGVSALREASGCRRAAVGGRQPYGCGRLSASDSPTGRRRLSVLPKGGTAMPPRALVNWRNGTPALVRLLPPSRRTSCCPAEHPPVELAHARILSVSAMARSSACTLTGLVR